MAHDESVPLPLRLAAADRVVQESARDQDKARQLRRSVGVLLAFARRMFKLYMAACMLGVVFLSACVYIVYKSPLWTRLFALETRRLVQELFS